MQTAQQASQQDAVPHRGFQKLHIASQPLAELAGATELTRPAAVKAIWNHIRAGDLQDPEDKRYILCDEPLKKIFNTDRVDMFNMNLLLGEHLTLKPEDL